MVHSLVVLRVVVTITALDSILIQVETRQLKTICHTRHQIPIPWSNSSLILGVHAVLSPIHVVSCQKVNRGRESIFGLPVNFLKEKLQIIRVHKGSDTCRLLTSYNVNPSGESK